MKGNEYIRGTHCPMNKEKGLKYLQSAAENGLSEAFLELSTLYLEGKDLPMDVEKSYYYLERAAEYGEDYAALCLAIYHLSISDDYDAYKIKKDPQKGIEILTNLAANEDLLGMFLLAKHKTSGIHVKKDETAAKKLLKKVQEIKDKLKS
ncbi:MAG: hypothetical protein NEHIOOID_00718 [Holosporales bacterium]